MAVDLTITQLATTTRTVTVLRGESSHILDHFRSLRMTGQLRITLNHGGVSNIEWEQKAESEMQCLLSELGIDKERNGR